MVRDVAKMLASTMKESMFKPIESTAALACREVLEGELRISFLISQSSTVCQVPTLSD
jgi:hypothetical protein